MRTDITVLKQAQEQAEQANRLNRDQVEELELLYRMTPVGLSLLDRDCRILRINERLAAINGKTVAEHLGHTLKEIVPDVAGEVGAVVERVFVSGEPVLDLAIHGITASDPTKDARLAGQLLSA